jgi:hypothetical protein
MEIWKKIFEEQKDVGGVIECVTVSGSSQAGTFVLGHAVGPKICML